jgi:hypothetical protein
MTVGYSMTILYPQMNAAIQIGEVAKIGERAKSKGYPQFRGERRAGQKGPFMDGD